jgi:hypothetical protein
MVASVHAVCSGVPGCASRAVIELLRALRDAGAAGKAGSLIAQLWRSLDRYIWPSELDLMAQLADFELEPRHGDWTGARFRSA